MNTPEHDKLREVRGISQALHEFLLEFLPSKGVHLATWYEGEVDDVLAYTNISPQKLVAEFLDIDLDKLENEKLALIEEMRNAKSE